MINQQSVQLDLSKIEYSDSVKKKIRDSFSEVLKLLQFDIKDTIYFVDGMLIIDYSITRSLIKKVLD